MLTLKTPTATHLMMLDLPKTNYHNKMWLLMIYEASAANAKEFTHSFHRCPNSHSLGEGFSERLFLSLFILTFQPGMLVLIQFECCLWFNLFFPPSKSLLAIVVFFRDFQEDPSSDFPFPPPSETLSPRCIVGAVVLASVYIFFSCVVCLLI